MCWKERKKAVRYPASEKLIQILFCTTNVNQCPPIKVYKAHRCVRVALISSGKMRLLIWAYFGLNAEAYQPAAHDVDSTSSSRVYGDSGEQCK